MLDLVLQWVQNWINATNDWPHTHTHTHLMCCFARACNSCHITKVQWATVCIKLTIINPWHILKGYGSRFMCMSVCLCICYHANCYIPNFFVEIQVSLGFLCCFQRMHCVDFHWKRFVQKFWWHLLITSAFSASWPALSGQTRQRWLLFK